MWLLDNKIQKKNFNNLAENYKDDEEDMELLRDTSGEKFKDPRLNEDFPRSSSSPPPRLQFPPPEKYYKKNFQDPGNSYKFVQDEDNIKYFTTNKKIDQNKDIYMNKVINIIFLLFSLLTFIILLLIVVSVINLSLSNNTTSDICLYGMIALTFLISILNIISLIIPSNLGICIAIIFLSLFFLGFLVTFIIEAITKHEISEIMIIAYLLSYAIAAIVAYIIFAVEIGK